MSNSPDFIKPSSPSTGFLGDIKASWRSCWLFLVDQAPINLIFLLIYAGLLMWDYRAMDLTTALSPPDWYEEFFSWFPPLLKILNFEWSHLSSMTWRGKTADFIGSIFWMTALLFMADRSLVFVKRQVSGIVPYLFRVLMIIMLLVLPALLGLGLLIVPGLFVLLLFGTATVIAVFKDQSAATAIRLAYRLLRFGRADHPRILGLSPIAFRIGGFMLLVTLFDLGISVLVYAIHSLALLFTIEHASEIALASIRVAIVISSLVDLMLQVFILRFYAEFYQTHLVEDEAVESVRV